MKTNPDVWHGELYSGVILRQKGCTEDEKMAKSITRPATCTERVLQLRHDDVGLLLQALHPPSFPQLVGLHV